MIKTGTVKLDNGLLIVYSQDLTKKNSHAEVITKFGSRTDAFLYKNKKYHITPGIHHLLEHAIIDNSIYGNAFDSFKDDYVIFNGYTNQSRTSFYISDLLDFKNNLVKLIKVVNKPKFSKKGLEKTKKPVIEEIRKNKDNRFKNIVDANNKATVNIGDKKDTLGSIKNINSITLEEIKLVHDIFYQPSNQIITLSGNFDLDEIVNLIKKTYKSLHLKKRDFEEIKLKERDSVYKKNIDIVDKKNEEYTEVTYKINISSLTPKEKVKLTFYSSFLLSQYFKDGSNVYNYMVDNKYTVYSIEYGTKFWCDYILFDIGCFTKNSLEFKKLVLDVIDKMEIDEEEFEVWKNNTIISLLLREEHPSSLLTPFVDNILTFDYYDIDKIEDIVSFSIDDFYSLINRLDFKNYAFITRHK